MIPVACGPPWPIACRNPRYSSGLKSQSTGIEIIMVRISIFSLALACLLTGLRAPQVEGQSIPSHFQFFETKHEAGILVGITGQSTGRFGYGPKPGPSFGARYGFHLGGAFGLEGVFEYKPTTRDMVDPTREEGDMVVGEADAEMMSFDGRLSFSLTGDRTWRRLNPFLFIGGGIAWDAAGESEGDALLLPADRFEFGVRFVALLGGGVRWLLSERVLIRTDIALTMNQLKAPEGFLDPARALKGVGEKEWVSGPAFSVGVAYRF